MFREHWKRLEGLGNKGRDLLGQVGTAGKRVGAKSLRDPRMATAMGLTVAVSLAVVFDAPLPSSHPSFVAPAAGPVAALRAQALPKPLIVESPWLDLEELRENAEPADKVFAVLRHTKRVLSRRSSAKPGNVMVVTNNAVKLHQTFRSMGYHLERVRSGEQAVPRLYLASLPADLPRLNSVQTRKAVFIKTILPLILRANEEILRQRRHLIVLKERIANGKILSSAASLWLETLAGRYEVANRDINELLNRVDIIPPSLALAQAAEESGWGTSRFAQEGNALFGQRTSKESVGIVPKGASGEQNIKVKSFGKLYDGIKSYVRNLNVHRAYRLMRKARAELRRRNGESAEFNGIDLARTLISYSERGEAYVHTIQSIMRYNNLDQFDAVRLSNKAAFIAKFSGT
ncbi:MAG: glucosaminidase domain-containing protein [Alphaproteobacteria bacterium]